MTNRDAWWKPNKVDWALIIAWPVIAPMLFARGEDWGEKAASSGSSLLGIVTSVTLFNWFSQGSTSRRERKRKRKFDKPDPHAYQPNIQENVPW